jgi:pimeloyl-ACP methyl ester carboxylesterase
MQFFSSDGVRIAFVDVRPDLHADTSPPDGIPDRGGEPIVLVHGFASNHVVNWVNTQWVRVLGRAGRRVVMLDNRGHGRSEKLYDPAAYDSDVMARDVANLMDHLGIERADVMGYSMGARITAHLAIARPERVRSVLLGGLGIHLVEGVGLPMGIADAMEAPALESLTDPLQRMFRAFAEQTGSDLRALAACIRGSRQTLTPALVGRIAAPTLVSVGTKDPIAGDPHRLAALIPRGMAFDIPGRDHSLAVGDRSHKDAVLSFLESRP